MKTTYNHNFCPFCGNCNFTKTWKFCPHCGTSLSRGQFVDMPYPEKPLGDMYNVQNDIINPHKRKTLGDYLTSLD